MSGALALVLHSHMPYVEGFGTWPFGEEWLWEAVAGSYVPLLDVLDEDTPVTISTTPVLADQLAAPGALERCLAFLEETRPETHRRDVAAAQDPGVAAELERGAALYAETADRLASVDLLAELMARTSWTSAATHAVLPLVATGAGVRLQVRTGIEAHRGRAEHWDGGFWLPECAHAPWLEPLLEAEGVRAVCVEHTDLGLDPGRPLRTAAGLTLVPIDRTVVDLVWSLDGYPCHPAYRCYHRLTEHRHRAWANDGSAYDAERAAAVAREHAADFVARVAERVAAGALCVFAVDTELLGHWWHEGPAWLAAVLGEAESAGLPVLRLDEAIERAEIDPAPADLPVTTWGKPRTLWTWSGPQVADLAWAARAAELRTVARARGLAAGAARELLALQASDWAFLATADTAGPYPRERAAGHLERLDGWLAGRGDEAALRGIAPGADPDLLLA